MKKILLLFVSIFTMGTIFAQSTVTLHVDMSADSTFDPAMYDVYISGSFWTWPQPGTDETLKLTPDETNTIYSITVDSVPDGEFQYKYFLVDENGPSWNNGEWPGDPNRVIVVAGDAEINDVWADKPWGVTFNVDITNDTTFDAEHDQIFIAGDLANGWAQPGTIPYYAMSDAGDGIFTITLMLYAGDYQYKYFKVTDGTPSWDGGEWPGDPNRAITVDTTMDVNDVWGSPAGVNQIPAAPQFSIYPNPVRNTLNITSLENANRIEVYNLLGQKVKEINEISGSNVAIETSDLTKGMYVVSVFGDMGTVKSLKFLKK